MKLVHVINNRKMNARDAADDFAATQGREVKWRDDGTFQFVHGHNVYKAIIGNGWEIFLVTDGNTPEVTVTL